MALYSASALEHDTTLWFLLVLVIKFPLKKEQYHVVDLLSEGDPGNRNREREKKKKDGSIDQDQRQFKILR
jgi:hypothetical protein